LTKLLILTKHFVIPEFLFLGKIDVFHFD